MNDNDLQTRPWRFQFTIARLLACTTVAALAAWTATARLPMTVTIRAMDREFNLLPLILTTILLTVAIGVLIHGKPGLAQWTRIGCGLSIAAFTLASAVLAIAEVVRWLI
jgi:hypothetical protein